MTEANQYFAGLSSAEVEQLQKQYGKNDLTFQAKEGFFKKAFRIICEPMFLLLIAAAIIYFILGEPRDGAIMLIFVLGIISIDIVQEWKTDKTLDALKDLSAPQVTVIRDGQETVIQSANLVPGDIMIIFEGIKIPADGFIIKCSDLCVNESSLTGEAEGVWKVNADFPCTNQTEEYWRRDYCYAGTLVTQGTAMVLVDKIGANTEYGKIGINISSAPAEKTPLQKQTGRLVKLCAYIAAVLFVLVSLFTYINIQDIEVKNRIIASILSGITLAMAMIPEEFPVILAVFLSMGAWRLAKQDSLVRKLSSVETLGAVSVLCVDKTGTITMNMMTVTHVWAMNVTCERLIETMGLACETDAYDPMEKAMLCRCEEQGLKKEQLFNGELIFEYAFTNELKMMGHVWKRNDEIIIAAKGSPENILSSCLLSKEDIILVNEKIAEMSAQGLRVIAVAEMKPNNENEIPQNISCCSLTFLGLIGLSDPPRKGIEHDIALCKRAGIRVVMITGDNGITASAIAKKIGIPCCDNIITGEMLDRMSDEELREKVKTVSIFSRVIPEHKMRIVKAFKDNGEIVAMTGDGVNDAPALKYADIGIAMGMRGSEVSREAADIILMDDNFSTILNTVKDGRRIYDNIRKAVGYVFTIHIPVALACLLAPMLGIVPSALFLLPLHVVLLELVIDPTCSIVLERQPAETNIMDRPPRNTKENIVNVSLLIKSIFQGLVIFAASFGTYIHILSGVPENAPLARTMGLAIIILSNLFLVHVNSSDSDFAYKSAALLIKDKVMWAVTIITLTGLLAIVNTSLCNLLNLSHLSASQFFYCVGIAAASVLWYEVIKFIKKAKRHSRNKVV